MNLHENMTVAVGEKAPDFELKDQLGKNWRLSDHLGNVVAMIFYPSDDTMISNKQLLSMREVWVDYMDTKAEIVGIARGTSRDHLEFIHRYKLPMNLLADTDREVTNLFSRHGYLPAFLTRSIVIVDANGIIRTHHVMFRGSRPTNRSVLNAIYAARKKSDSVGAV